METRNIKITLNKAKEWYNSGNTTLKDIALQAFSKDKLGFNFKNITSFEKACNALNLNYDIISIIVKDVATYSRASAAMFKLNIIRKALNLGQDLHLTGDSEKFYIYYPFIPFATKDSNYYYSVLSSGKMEVIGKIKNEREEYHILSGYATKSRYAGLGNFSWDNGVGYINANIGFLGCASREIAQHFSKYFGILIIKAMYSDMIDFEIVENKYQN